MKQYYKFYHDAGHGWLAVPKKDIHFLGIENDISHFSYTKGNTVYLEEDCDCDLFYRSYEKIIGYKPVVQEVSHGNRSVIRSYQNYIKPVSILVFNPRELFL